VTGHLGFIFYRGRLLNGYRDSDSGWDIEIERLDRVGLL